MSLFVIAGEPGGVTKVTFICRKPSLIKAMYPICGQGGDFNDERI